MMLLRISAENIKHGNKEQGIRSSVPYTLELSIVYFEIEMHSNRGTKTFVPRWILQTLEMILFK